MVSVRVLEYLAEPQAGWWEPTAVSSLLRRRLEAFRFSDSRVKNLLTILLCFSVLSCAAFDKYPALTRIVVQAAMVYISVQHPELVPEARAVLAVATGDESTREADLKALRDSYLSRLNEDGLGEEDRAKAEAIAAFVDSVIQLAKQNPEQLPWLAHYLDTMDTGK